MDQEVGNIQAPEQTSAYETIAPFRTVHQPCYLSSARLSMIAKGVASLDKSTKYALIAFGSLAVFFILDMIVHTFGLIVAAVLIGVALTSRRLAAWKPSYNPAFYGIIVAILICGGMELSDREAKWRKEREVSELTADMDKEQAADDAAYKASLSPDVCASERANPKTRAEMKQSCYNQYPEKAVGSWLARGQCEVDQERRMKACGVDFIPDVD